MTFDYNKFYSTESLDEKRAVLGCGIAAFLEKYPKAEGVPLEQAGRNTPYHQDQNALFGAINAVYTSADAPITVGPSAMTMQDACERLEPYFMRGRQGTALSIFNNLANSPVPEKSHEELLTLVGKRDEATGLTHVELPGYCKHALSNEIARRMAQAHTHQAARHALRLHRDPIGARNEALKHIAAARDVIGPHKPMLADAELTIDTLFIPACEIVARRIALDVMQSNISQANTPRGDDSLRKVHELLGASRMSLVDIFSEGATINGDHLSPQECEQRFYICVGNLNRVNRANPHPELK